MAAAVAAAGSGATAAWQVVWQVVWHVAWQVVWQGVWQVVAVRRVWASVCGVASCRGANRAAGQQRRRQFIHLHVAQSQRVVDVLCCQLGALGVLGKLERLLRCCCVRGRVLRGVRVCVQHAMWLRVRHQGSVALAAAAACS
jgi:hypothetical protein